MIDTRTGVYQGVKTDRFSEKFAHVLNRLSFIYVADENLVKRTVNHQKL